MEITERQIKNYQCKWRTLQKSVSENLDNPALCAFIGELLGIEEDAIS